MKKGVLHDVHILAVVRVLVKDVRANSPKRAIEAAEQKVDLEQICKQLHPHFGADYVEFNDDIIGYIVDAKVGEKIAGTGVYDEHGKPSTLDSPIR